MATLTAADTASTPIFVPPGRALRIQVSNTYAAKAVLERQSHGGGWIPVPGYEYSASAIDDRILAGSAGGRYRLHMTQRTSGTLTYTLSAVALKLVEYRDNNGVLRFAVDADGVVTGLTALDGVAIGSTTPAAVNATVVNEASEAALTAHAGGTKAAALALDATKTNHQVSVCATNDDSVLLPSAVVGQRHFVMNSGAATLRVFGAGNDTINDVAAATGVTQATGVGALYVCCVAGKWYRLLGG